jgi:hypothetical protein
MKDSKKNPAPIAPASTAPIASSSAKPRYSAPEKGTLIKKTGNAKGGTDPYVQDKPSRKFVTSPGASGGARYGVRVKFQQTTAPEAGATQGNGRIFASAVARQAPEFGAGMKNYN